MGAPCWLWWFQGEAFLAANQPRPAEVLIVEGWIGFDGIQAAKLEFESGGYLYAVATGGLSGNSRDRRRWSFAAEADKKLLLLGLPPDRIMVATPIESEEHRTFETALAVKRALQARGVQPKDVNVITLGVHARRSRLVLAKVLGPAVDVGVIAWTPPGYFAGPWWRSSDRAQDLMKETVGYLFELLLNSGRTSNSRAGSAPVAVGGKP